MPSAALIDRKAEPKLKDCFGAVRDSLHSSSVKQQAFSSD